MQQFGGDWTEKKLTCLKKYLGAYTTIMSNQKTWNGKLKFRYAYIDAFAGTGYRELKEDDDMNNLLFPELAEEEPQTFLDGSARIALNTVPRFTKYIFIEKDEQKYSELNRIKVEFPNLKKDIRIVNADANSYLYELCTEYNWDNNRAVLFLDPFGMQVEWKTIEAIAKTKAIDLWILFPLGIGVNRLLKRDGNIILSLKNKLDRIFGTPSWYVEFYKSGIQSDLFGNHEEIKKDVSFDKISGFFIKRLKTVFAGVAENPLKLLNSKNNPLFLLCFASANPRGTKTAIKIAQNILKLEKKCSQ